MPTATLNTVEHEARREAIRKFENSHTPTKKDKGRFAMRPGKRISKNGNVYYEYRGNRADANVNMHNSGYTIEDRILLTLENIYAQNNVALWDDIEKLQQAVNLLKDGLPLTEKFEYYS
jgi:hypothetical protein